jgi:murein DD-endopeptidase MepM/ murein hydrolase activator NlpD
MAIYQSKGRRVQLEGREIQRGFRGQQIYDPTQSLSRAASDRIQKAGEAANQYSNQLSQLSRDFDALGQQNTEALVNFSETLSKFVVEKQKEYNENQKNLGIADILNGKTELNPKLLEKYEQDRDYLEKANDAEVQAIAEVEQQDPALAESLYQESKAIGGWRGYGQAVGKAMMGAGSISSFFSAFLASDEPIQTTVNGQVQTFTPRTAKTREQLEAVWEVGTQKFLQTSGLNQLNPVILAEHVTPIMVRARGELLGQKMQDIIEVRRSNQLEDKRAEIYAGKKNFGDAKTAQQEILRLNKWATDYYGGDRTKANEETHNMMTHMIRVTASEDYSLATRMFNQYRNANLNPDKPSLGTYGDRYDLTDLATFLDKTSDKKKAEADAVVDDEAEGITKVFYANPSKATYNEAMRRLEELRTKNPTPGVLAEIDRLQNRGPNWNPGREEALVESATSLGELAALKAAGYISSDAYERGSQRFASEQEAKDILPGNRQNLVRGAIREVTKDQVGNVPEAFVEKSQGAVNAIVGLAEAVVLNNAAKARAAGKEYTALDAQRDFDAAVKSLLPEFVQIQKDRRNNVSQVKFHSTPQSDRLSRATASTNTSKAGTGLDLVNTALERLPKTTSAVKDVVLSPERITLSMEVLRNGGQVPSDVQFAAQTAGVSVPEYLRRQAAQYDMEYNEAELGQGANNYLENKKVSPRIANALANPRTSPEQRRQLERELARLKAQQQLPLQPIRQLESFKAQVSSVTYEDYVPGKRGQPGLDISFKDKQVPVVMDGRVKDISYEPGYGNYVVIESTDPETGEQVDVLYAHLASRSPLTIGQQVSAGQLVGIQGGTGNVQSADGTIASIDFLAPAPRGSGSMKPYRNFDRLRRRIGATFGY